MFRIRKLTNQENCLELSSNISKAIINLDLGASLQELTLEEKTIIADNSADYKENYASSILFPFGGRIEDGKYTFNNKDYQLHCNDDKYNMALHGLVFDKKFILKEQKESGNSISVIVEYEATEGAKGYPFLYKLSLEYTLSQNSFKLKMSVENTGTETFPFFFGWHPYFESSNINESIIDFKSDKKIEYNDRLAAIGVSESKNTNPVKIEDKEFNDCFFLTNSTVKLETPDYKISLKSDAERAFLQMYTPPNRKSIALEPQIGVSNNFNNKISLHTLAPKNKFTTNWKITKEE